MIEVFENLHVGNQEDYEKVVARQNDWAVLHACKIPYHKELVGYTQKALPNTHPEYLYARRGLRLALNMIDGPDPKYTSPLLVDAALGFISENLGEGRKTLVHCNQGASRSPSLALLYLAINTDALPKDSLENAESSFLELYPRYNPMMGIRGYIKANWAKYVCN
jgi:predicted protein tyrosine phosphatase